MHEVLRPAPRDLYRRIVTDPALLISELKLMLVDPDKMIDEIVGQLEEGEAAVVSRAYGYSAKSTLRKLAGTNISCFMYDLMFRLLHESGWDVAAHGYDVPEFDAQTIVNNERILCGVQSAASL